MSTSSYDWEALGRDGESDSEAWEALERAEREPAGPVPDLCQVCGDSCSSEWQLELCWANCGFCNQLLCSNCWESGQQHDCTGREHPTQIALSANLEEKTEMLEAHFDAKGHLKKKKEEMNNLSTASTAASTSAATPDTGNRTDDVEDYLAAPSGASGTTNTAAANSYATQEPPTKDTNELDAYFG